MVICNLFLRNQWLFITSCNTFSNLSTLDYYLNLASLVQIWVSKSVFFHKLCILFTLGFRWRFWPIMGEFRPREVENFGQSFTLISIEIFCFLTGSNPTTSSISWRFLTFVVDVKSQSIDMFARFWSISSPSGTITGKWLNFSVRI